MLVKPFGGRRGRHQPGKPRPTSAAKTREAARETQEAFDVQFEKNVIDENGAEGKRSRSGASNCGACEADAILVRRREGEKE